VTANVFVEIKKLMYLFLSVKI